MFIGITAFNIRALDRRSSSNRTLSANNPLTYFERVQMISLNLIEEASIETQRFSFTPFPIEEPTLLPDFIPLSIPCFTTVREEWNRDKVKILLGLGYRVIVVREDLKKQISSSTIRKRISDGDPTWEQLVTPTTRRLVASLGIGERLRGLRET
jgi:nicotinamide mononucleotide adenylyltransferase